MERDRAHPRLPMTYQHVTNWLGADRSLTVAGMPVRAAGPGPTSTGARFDALLLGAAVPVAAEPCRRLLDANPHLKIVCLVPDGREAVLQERRLDRIHIENASFELILAALRDRCAVEKAG
jgi:hypothetical protein